MGHPMNIGLSSIVMLIMILLGFPVSFPVLMLADFIPVSCLSVTITIASIAGMYLNYRVLRSFIRWLFK